MKKIKCVLSIIAVLIVLSVLCSTIFVDSFYKKGFNYNKFAFLNFDMDKEMLSEIKRKGLLDEFKKYIEQKYYEEFERYELIDIEYLESKNLSLDTKIYELRNKAQEYLDKQDGKIVTYEITFEYPKGTLVDSLDFSILANKIERWDKFDPLNKDSDFQAFLQYVFIYSGDIFKLPNTMTNDLLKKSFRDIFTFDANYYFRTSMMDSLLRDFYKENIEK